MLAQPAFLGRLSFVSLELSFPPMMWFARGVELPDMMPVIACITPRSSGRCSRRPRSPDGRRFGPSLPGNRPQVAGRSSTCEGARDWFEIGDLVGGAIGGFTKSMTGVRGNAGPRPRRLKHDPEKCVAVFPRDKRNAFARRSCSNKKLERDGDSKKSHLALARIFNLQEET